MHFLWIIVNLITVGLVASIPMMPGHFKMRSSKKGITLTGRRRQAVGMTKRVCSASVFILTFIVVISSPHSSNAQRKNLMFIINHVMPIFCCQDLFRNTKIIWQNLFVQRFTYIYIYNTYYSKSNTSTSTFFEIKTGYSIEVLLI